MSLLLLLISILVTTMTSLYLSDDCMKESIRRSKNGNFFISGLFWSTVRIGSRFGLFRNNNNNNENMNNNVNNRANHHREYHRVIPNHEELVGLENEYN